MAVQQSRKSKSRKGMRRSHHHVAVPSVVLCPCGSPSLPHVICPSCGNYRGREFTEAAKA